MVNRPAVWGAIAAAIAMNVVLVVVLLSGSGEGEPIADQGAPAYELEKQMPAIVATLTAERRAVWDRRPGEDLYAGQRFTLTQGFAEITTARGAVAILEAPAKIELSDNNNAIWLHAGKLVGICETDSSKGFLVRTPRMDVADLGTRFGVDVAHTGSTEVHVLEGVVAVSKPDARTGGATLRLAAGESARAADSDLEIVRIDQDTARFAALLLYAVPLPGTGQGLALGETDSNWRVTAIDGEPLDPPGTMAVRDAHDDYAGPPFLPNDPQTSQWLLIDRQLGQSGTGPVTFTCQGRFELPSDVDPSEVRLVVSFDADDAATAIRLNGHPVAVPENEFEDGSRDLHVMTIRRHLVAGQNTIEFDVMDPRSAGAAVSGLRVKLSLRSIGQRDP
ncbi:MAG: FecR domain-containing protein [Planctomycetota bacterium]